MEYSGARQIIQTLAQGKDPFTAEPFPLDHFLNHPEVVQALLAASAAMELPAARVQRRAHLPENVGRQWTEAEEQELIVEFRSGKTPEEIAAQHGRSLTGIEARLERLGFLTAEQRVTRNRFRRNSARAAAAAAAANAPQMDSPLVEGGTMESPLTYGQSATVVDLPDSPLDTSLENSIQPLMETSLESSGSSLG